MPDSADLAELRRVRAIEAAERWLLANVGSVRRLTKQEVRLYSGRRLVAGWRFPVTFPDRAREFDLLLCDKFPWKVPRIALVGLGFLVVPHVESDGVLCVLPEHSEVDPNHPVESVQNVICAAAQMVSECANDAKSDDFRAEFRSYWCSDNSAPLVYTIFNPTSPSRLMKVWRGRGFYLVGDDTQVMQRWLNHYTNTEVKRTFDDGILLWLSQVLLPSEYPRTAVDVLCIAKERSDGGEEIIRQIAATMPKKIVAVIGATAANGPALGAVIITPPAPMSRGPGKQKINPLHSGFRPGRTPPELLQSRMFGSSPIMKSAVERADTAWVHGRGTDPRQPELAEATVVVLGCGSVGSPLATLLAQAGVGRLILIDPELLAWANIGRHSLGASSVWRSKAIELSLRLRREYPHVREVVGKQTIWENVARDAPDLLTSSDLIISTIGSWAAEGALNEWHLGLKRLPPVLYGWTEAHACAGHAVTITKDGGCFACQLSNFGVPRLRVTEWPAGVSRHQEPACGAVFQPYGPVELSHIVATIADLALDTLLGKITTSTSRIWCGSSMLLNSSGGHWTEEWKSILGDRSEGAFRQEMPWRRSASCTMCGHQLAQYSND